MIPWERNQDGISIRSSTKSTKSSGSKSSVSEQEPEAVPNVAAPAAFITSFLQVETVHLVKSETKNTISTVTSDNGFGISDSELASESEQTDSEQ